MKRLMKRYLHASVTADLSDRMVFLGGPRQVGKTTLARQIMGENGQSVYLNWDNRQDRKRMLAGHWAPESKLLVFDEAHKYARWKGWIKGVWDTRPAGQQVMVTGSSRLDVFRRGGDSLLGRYRYYRLHPLSLAEVHGLPQPKVEGMAAPPELNFEGFHSTGDLLRLGGFPQPFLAGDERNLRRWHRERFERVFREDIRDLETVRSLSQVELLGQLLPERVGAPCSYSSLAQEIETSPKTVRAWLDLLCRNYYVFRVPPYHRKIERALKKESKYYLWDWSEVPSEGFRFENMVAVHLLKWCHFMQDTEGVDVELTYVRDLEKREVDFLVVWKKKPWMLVECKLQADRSPAPLKYFAAKLGLGCVYQVTLSDRDDYRDPKTGVRTIPAGKFLSALV